MASPTNNATDRWSQEERDVSSSAPGAIGQWLNVRCPEHEKCMALKAHGIGECFECEVPGGR